MSVLMVKISNRNQETYLLSQKSNLCLMSVIVTLVQQFTIYEQDLLQPIAHLTLYFQATVGNWMVALA